MMPISNQHRRRLFLLLAALVFLSLLILNFLTPYLADDFTFAYAFDTGARLHSLPQLMQSLAYHYREWTGRVVVKFFAQGFTMLPKAVFNFCNAAAYLGLGLVIYRLARGRRTGRYDVLAFVLIEIALWEISPAFGQTNLWMCGSCNYLWASLGCLAFLLPWRYSLQKTFSAGWCAALGMAVVGLLAGWLSENTSAGMLACAGLCLLWTLVRRHRAPLWMWTGFCGAVAGFVLLIAAPGNYNRAGNFADATPTLTKYAVRFFRCSNMLRDNALPLLLAFAALFALLAFQKYSEKGVGRAAQTSLFWPLALLTGALAANYAMILSPFYYERSSHGVFSLLTAACAACLVQLHGTWIRRVLTACAACLCVVCAFDVCDGAYDIASYFVMYSKRDAAIRAQITGTEQEPSGAVVTYGIEPYTRWCGAYGLPDIRANGEDSIALARAKWYGTVCLTAEETRTYLFPGHTNSAYEEQADEKSAGEESAPRA